MKKPRRPQLNFEATREFIAEVKQISNVIEIPVAQMAREGLRDKIAELKRTHPKLKDQPAQVELSK